MLHTHTCMHNTHTQTHMCNNIVRYIAAGSSSLVSIVISLLVWMSPGHQEMLNDVIKMWLDFLNLKCYAISIRTQ